jgi:hypothetical protein
MDIFPEMALAWAFGASGEGDLIGNLTKLNQVDKNGITSKAPIVEKHEERESRPVPEEDLPPFLNNQNRGKNTYDDLRSNQSRAERAKQRYHNNRQGGYPKGKTSGNPLDGSIG